MTIDRKVVDKIATSLIKANGVNNLTYQLLSDALGVTLGSFRHEVGCTFSQYMVKAFKRNKKEWEDYVSPISTRSRVDPDFRKQQILMVAVEVAEKLGFNNFMRTDVAEAADVSCALVSKYYASMEELPNIVLRHAIKNKNLTIIAQAVVLRHPFAKKIPKEIKKEALLKFI